MIYIIQFSEPLGNLDNPRATARYYVGYCDDDRIELRLEQHRSGRGAAITRAAAERGITMDIAFSLPGDRSIERAIKSRKNTPKLIEQINTKGIPQWLQNLSQ